MPKTPKRKLTPEQLEANRNRKVITDAVCDYMHNHHRDEAIDSILCRPLDALAMGVKIAHSLARINRDQLRCLKEAVAILSKEPAAIEVINSVCRTALASRKRGDLKRDRY